MWELSLKKILASVMVVMLFSMTGCSSDSGGKTVKKEKDIGDMTFAEHELDMDGITGRPYILSVIRNRFYFLTGEWDETEGEENEHTMRLYSREIDENQQEEIALPKFQEDESINSMFVTESGEIVLLICTVSEGTEERIYSVRKLDEGGKELSHEELEGFSGDEVSGFILDKEGDVLIAGDDKVMVFDESGKKKGEIKGDARIAGVALTKDGQVVCGSSDNGSVCIRVLEIKTEKWRERIELNSDSLQFSYALISSNTDDPYDFYYKDESGLYGYSMSDRESKKLVDYKASGIGPEDSYDMAPSGKETYIGIKRSGNSADAVLVQYTRADPSAEKEKTVITFGNLYSVQPKVEQLVREFNRTNEKYKIEFVDYGDLDDAEGKLHMDILTGKTPDVMMLDYMPVDQYIEKGILEDLTPYIEKDAELDKEDILDSVWEAIQKDGRVYYLAPSFMIYTMTARKGDVGDRTGWNMEEFTEAVKEMDDGSGPFFTQTKSLILLNIIWVGNALDNFVDWETGKCSFDSQEFKELLEFCNMGQDKADYSSEEELTESAKIKENKVLLNDVIIGKVHDVQAYHTIYEGDMNFVGYPDKGRNGSVYSFHTQVGINSKSKVKEGAWEFVRLFMTKKYQLDLDALSSSIPTRKDAYEDLCRAAMETESNFYETETGERISTIPKAVGWWSDAAISIGPLTQEEVDLCTDLINHTRKVWSYDSSIGDIVKEEAEPYFHGEKSLEETVQVIQQRVETYINENR